MKNKTTLRIWIWLVFVLLVSGYFYPQMEGEQIVTHWNLEGNADGYGPKWMIFVMPLLIVVLDLFLVGMRRIDPKRQNYDKFHGVFQMIRSVLALFLGILCILTTIAQIYPERINIGSVITLLIGVLFLVLGNLMPRIRPNWFAGFRTPWTLADETVWRKTHRLTGRLWFIGGFLMIASTLLPSNLIFWMIMGIVIIITLIPTIYSYLIYKNLKRKEIYHD